MILWKNILLKTDVKIIPLKNEDAKDHQLTESETSNELPVHSIQNTAPWARYQSSEEENSSTYLTEAVKETDIRSSDANV